MGRENQEPQQQQRPLSRRVLIVGNYCHDVLIKDDVVIAESLGGAASFISVVLDGLSIPSAYVAKVGSDFAYPVSHDPIVSPSSKTTLFHAHFSSEPTESRRQDRVLKRVRSCDPILPSDLPGSRFDFGLAVGVGGEILPETLDRMLDLCTVVFVDVQALIRVFDSVDGTVKMIGLKESGFFHLLPRIGFLKASAEEAPFVDVDEARKLCCVVVTNGKDGCTVHWKDAEYQIAPFSAVQIDPTGAGDSFLGGLVAGLVQGLAVPDAALLGNFCGSLTVGHIGLPKFDPKLLQRVKDEVCRRKMQCSCCLEGLDDRLKFVKPLGHDQFHSALGETKLAFSCSTQECQRDLVNSTAAEQDIHYQFNGQQKVLLNPVFEEPIQSNSSMP
ncbi:Inositol 3-kinase [Actinidia chinensis var. chinensis]|uniref:Inositol 3-kinase n=1 Tax=Actinidia chinensis var. chinensis TaxID=1590841 RepID=A0A2R6P694_ACTCC|nr:Inositol 3-kinase [Actinidia chinensis var. chinensis]